MAKKQQPAKDQDATRKGGYPYYPLRQCLKLAGIVRDQGGDRSSVPKSVIAKGLGLSQSSSGFALLVASAKTFGMVEGIGELQLTVLGRSYFFPTTDRESQQAELGFMVEPPVFRELVKRLDGSKMPNSAILANILAKLGVKQSWRMRAAQIFANTATELRAVDAAGFLRYEAALHTSGGPPAAGERTDSMVGHSRVNSTIEREAERQSLQLDAAGGNVWVYSEGGGTVRLETPDPMPLALWDRLKRYVDVLKPEGSHQQGGRTNETISARNG